MRSVFFMVLLCLTFAFAKAQNPTVKPKDTVAAKIDTLKEPAYVNKGKIAGRKAVMRSLIFPGLGQIYNYQLIVQDVKANGGHPKQVGQKLYTIGKLLGIYAGGTALVLSYIDNNNNYKLFLNELQYRQTHNGQANPENGLQGYTDTQRLTLAKNVSKRNREIVIMSMVGLYGAAALEAYVAARLKFFNIDENVSLKISPSTINTQTMYGFQSTPGLKLTLRL